jgi:glycoprotein 6-alpha-L-fucosyltransferase
MIYEGRIIANFYENYHPFSQTCTKIQNYETREQFAGSMTSASVIDIPISTVLVRWSTKLTIPADLAPRLSRLFENPFAWWMGQFQKYYVKPLPKLQKMINNVNDGYAIKSPIACVHVRRSEKIELEAKYVPLQIYMSFVKEYFDQLIIENPGAPRNVFLAADDPQVFQEARSNFTNYKFITNEKSAKLVHLIANRVGQNYMAYTDADFQILAECDFVVLTYSSNFGRRIHEMKYNHFVDATERVISVDTNYFVHIQNDIDYMVVQRHVSHNPNVILEVGIVVVSIKYNSNPHNGTTKVNFKDFELYVPNFKLEEILYSVDMPNFG